MDSKLYQDFLRILEAQDKEKCINFALEKLKQGDIDIVFLYEGILGPALNNIKCSRCEQKVSIWREHMWSSIVRAVVECVYPCVLNQRDVSGIKKKGCKVAVVCPEGELHEIGARMVSDFFCLCGYESIFIGSSTPELEWTDLAEVEKPDWFAVSVTNFYNLVPAQKAIQRLREQYGSSIRILIGGTAFKVNAHLRSTVGADAYIETFRDIRELSEKEGLK